MSSLFLRLARSQVQNLGDLNQPVSSPKKSANKLLGAKGIATNSKKLLVAPGITTRSKKLLGAKESANKQEMRGLLGRLFCHILRGALPDLLRLEKQMSANPSNNSEDRTYAPAVPAATSAFQYSQVNPKKWWITIQARLSCKCRQRRSRTGPPTHRCSCLHVNVASSIFFELGCLESRLSLEANLMVIKNIQQHKSGTTACQRMT